ncbi:hypothetical protein [Viridibacillus arvi]|uniref:hypothetical protein n=1 Tax=Viridibacillus arvi TaxID=263475 RepID=UPI003D2BD72F
MYNKRRLFLLIVSIILFCSACTTEKEIKKTENQESPESAIEKDEKTTVNVSPLKEININDHFTSVENKVRKEKYTISGGKCSAKNNLIAPAYVDDERIIFLLDEEKSDKILEFSRSKGSCKEIYSSVGISYIIGNESNIFWLEYDTTKVTGVDWTIKNLNLKNYKINEISTGGSYKDTPVPTIKLGKGSINWIEYESKGDSLISKLMKWQKSSGKVSVLEEVVLDESDKRDGEYYIIQHGVQSNILLYKSIFKKGEKTLSINLYEKGHFTPPFIKQDQIIDFNMNENYFVYTNEGSLTAIDLNKSNTQFKYKTGDKLTTDTPIFINDQTLVFRYAMNDIILLNFEKNVRFSISGKHALISKPIFTNNYLSYAVKNNIEDNKTNFYVVKLVD